MKAAIHNPYWDTLGGGERYTASFAQALLKEGYSVHVDWKDNKILKKIENRFSLNLKGAKVVRDINRGDGYDLCFWVSDGSIPTLKSRNNFLHFQFPFKDLNGKSLINRMKFMRIKKNNCKFRIYKRFYR